ncbi:hypothetical protein [Streptomyces longispororuber]|uniref:hypothetical protein n=1 Tax=Streptomyces longispororuber TaxID=68230 RepID=UPI0036FF5A0B
MSSPFMSPEEHRRQDEADIARDTAAVLPKLTAHRGLHADFLDRAFLEVRGLFESTDFMPDTPENRRALDARELSFGYDVISGLHVARLALLGWSWLTPPHLHALNDGQSVNHQPHLPRDRSKDCPCLRTAES